jgi:hypothetical protein
VEVEELVLVFGLPNLCSVLMTGAIDSRGGLKVLVLLLALADD